jgi:glycosyltransferase involved in cell wall biosynthesis
MKHPGHAVPSGDREIARLLIRALSSAGHNVEVASRFASRDGKGDAARQARLRDIGARLAARLVRRYRARPAAERPAAWLTYHVYHKAPDWLGPAVAEAMNIPYLIVEASSAPKRAGGAWDIGYRGANAAIAHADAVLSLNSDDTACLEPVMDPTAWHKTLLPFVEAEPFAELAGWRGTIRETLARRCRWNPEIPWLLAVGMMRGGDKSESYAVLAKALFDLLDEPWHLLVVGGGPNRAAIVRRLTAAAPGRISFLGQLSKDSLALVYAASDLFVWPAINEAFGMALLEAQAAGLPVVAGNQRGVPDIVAPGVTGLLPDAGDAPAFSQAVRRLLQDDTLRRQFGAAAARRVREKFDIAGAALELDRAFSLAGLHARNRRVQGAA